MKIVKIGGSLITDKGEYKKFNKNLAEKILSEISGEKLILVHGGGSFGHIASKKYGLPGKINETTLRGCSIVKNDMALLNNHIISIMVENGMNGIGFSPYHLWNGSEFDYKPVVKSFELGQIPVIYGDAYIDRDEIKIRSGDDIMVDLARIFKPESAIFFSDVDGVFDRDPKKYKDAKLIRRFKNESISFAGIENDVTGGMMKKFHSMMECREMGVKTYLINGQYPERIGDLEGEKFVGTEFV